MPHAIPSPYLRAAPEPSASRATAFAPVPDAGGGEPAVITGPEAPATHFRNPLEARRERLPAVAARKLSQIKLDLADVRASLGPLVDERQDVFLERQKKIQAIRDRHVVRRPNNIALADELARIGIDGRVVDAEHPDYLALRNGIENADADLAHIDEAIAARSARAQSLGQLVSAIERYLDRLGNVEIVAYDGPAPKVKRSGIPLEQLEAVRQQVAELRADAHAIRSAPTPSAEAKETARRIVDKLAANGPRCLGLIEGQDDVIWPRSHQHHLVPLPNAAPAVFTSENIDVLKILAWMDPDRLVAALDREIDELSDDDAALTEQERNAKLAALADEIIEIERAEESICEMIGAAVVRRVDCDPRAVLNLASSLPAPKVGY